MPENRTVRKSDKTKLPSEIRKLFWEYDIRTISWEKDRDLIVNKILHYGSWDAVLWLRAQFPAEALRDWLIERNGNGLDAKRLKYWELMLDIPKRTVDGWIAHVNENPWSKKTC